MFDTGQCLLMAIIGHRNNFHRFKRFSSGVLSALPEFPPVVPARDN